MKIRAWTTWTRVALLLVAVVSVPWVASRAQFFQGPLGNITAGGLLPLPPAPPQGAWGEVIFANEKWIVIQNHDGQQFPISAAAINQFLVRWPTTFAALRPNSLVEVLGVDLGSMTVQANHVDVYEGADQGLVQMGYRNLLPNGTTVNVIDPTFQRLMNAFDISAQNQLYGWAYPVNPGSGNIPGQFYAVGSAAGLNPLRLGVSGNNIATVLPDAGGNMSISQVTRGSAAFAQKGDYAFLTPVDLTAKTLVLAQMVLYKKIPLSQFAP